MHYRLKLLPPSQQRSIYRYIFRKVVYYNLNCRGSTFRPSPVLKFEIPGGPVPYPYNLNSVYLEKMLSVPRIGSNHILSVSGLYFNWSSIPFEITSRFGPITRSLARQHGLLKQVVINFVDLNIDLICRDHRTYKIFEVVSIPVHPVRFWSISPNLVSITNCRS